MKPLAFLLLIGFVVSGTLGLSYYFWPDLPTTPEVRSGRVYPISSGGHVYYLTKGQHLTHLGAIALSFVFLIGLVIMRKYVDDPTSRRPGKYIFPPPAGTGGPGIEGRKP